jgi:hypothetical protein
MECTVNMDLRIHYGEINRLSTCDGKCLFCITKNEHCSHNSSFLIFHMEGFNLISDIYYKSFHAAEGNIFAYFHNQLHLLAIIVSLIVSTIICRTPETGLGWSSKDTKQIHLLPSSPLVHPFLDTATSLHRW